MVKKAIGSVIKRGIQGTSNISNKQIKRKVSVRRSTSVKPQKVQIATQKKKTTPMEPLKPGQKLSETTDPRQRRALQKKIKKANIKATMATRITGVKTDIVKSRFHPKRIKKTAQGEWHDVDPDTGITTITLAKVGAPAAVGVASLGLIGTAYASEEKTPNVVKASDKRGEKRVDNISREGVARRLDPFEGAVAIGSDFYTGVTNVGSDYASIVTGGESKMSLNRLFEAGVDQIGMYGWDRPEFEKRSKEGTLPVDKEVALASKKPVATHVGEIVTEAGIWAGTMGAGRVLWGVGRGVKIAKVASKDRHGPIGMKGNYGFVTTGNARDDLITTTGRVFYNVSPFPTTAKGGAKKGLKEAWASTKKDPFGIQTLGREGIKGHMVGKTRDSLPKPRSSKDLRKAKLAKAEKMVDRRIKTKKLNKALKGRQYSTSFEDWYYGARKKKLAEKFTSKYSNW